MAGWPGCGIGCRTSQAAVDRFSAVSYVGDVRARFGQIVSAAVIVTLVIACNDVDYGALEKGGVLPDGVTEPSRPSDREAAQTVRRGGRALVAASAGMAAAVCKVHSDNQYRWDLYIDGPGRGDVECPAYAP